MTLPCLHRRHELVAASLLCLLVTACTTTEGREPEGLRLGRERSEREAGVCPVLDGKYRLAPNDIGYVIRSMLPWQEEPRTWSSVELSGHPDVALQMVATDSDGQQDTVMFRPGQDYDCDTGWLRPRDVDELNQWPSPRPRDGRSRRHDFLIASAKHGVLVGRHDIMSFEEFAVWCGDGCKGFPLPWTIRHHESWSILGDVNTPIPGEPVTELQERIAREERRLEQGPGLTPMEAWLVRTARAQLPEGVRLIGFGPRDNGMHLSISVKDTALVHTFVEAMQLAPGVRAARHEHLYRGRLMDGTGWTTVVLAHADSARWKEFDR